MADKCRIDKWLWAVRLFKTRTLAADAISSGKVKVEEESVKSSFQLTPGKIVTVRKGLVKYKYRVLGILEKRVGAELAKQYCEDITPEEELMKLRVDKMLPSVFREKGTGRPTKKERRDLDEWMED
ncbi:MAG: RNA-binding S4 domain-containing protein [Fimbriimonadaceae bacterium]|nr:RNA-binding S4 domain-containing protein [Chitinophagales bacterium]